MSLLHAPRELRPSGAPPVSRLHAACERATCEPAQGTARHSPVGRIELRRARAQAALYTPRPSPSRRHGSWPCPPGRASAVPPARPALWRASAGRPPRPRQDAPAASSRPRRRPSGWRCPARRCPARSRGRARTGSGGARWGRCWPTARRPSEPMSAPPRSVRMSPNRLLATTTSSCCGWSTIARPARRRAVLDADLGVVRRDRGHDLVPEHHRVVERVGLGGRHERPLALHRQFERVADDALGALAGEHRGLRHDLVRRAGAQPAADAAVLALGVLADQTMSISAGVRSRSGPLMPGSSPSAAG